ATWLALAFTRRVGPGGTGALLVLATVQAVALVALAGNARSSVAVAVFLVVVMVPTGLFLSDRPVILVALGAGVGLLAAWAAWVGVVPALTEAVPAWLVCTAAGLTTLFLARSAARQDAVDPDTGLPNGLALSRRIGPGIQRSSFLVAVVRLAGVDDLREALGFEVGTELFRRAVEDLGQVLPAAIFIGRVEGDEIVVTAALGARVDGAPGRRRSAAATRRRPPTSPGS
ncbi:MAG: hypothetical protein ACYDEN_07910, partial [Acidimicrobiales bacterium]